MIEPTHNSQQSNKLKIIFAGTPEFASETLEAIVQSQHQVIAVYTQPDRPAGRGKKLTASPVKQLALQHEIPVHQPQTLKSAEDQQILSDLEADIMVVVAYGLILPKAVLDSPKLGCLNIHASLLPRWRGAAPIQRAIAAGDTQSGITIMQMDEGLDTGEMLLKKQCPIKTNDTGEQLHDRLAALGASAIVECLDVFIQYRSSEGSQSCIKPEKPARKLHDMIRAFNSWPITSTRISDTTCRIWESVIPDRDFLTNPEANDYQPGTIISANKSGIDVTTGDGILRITRLQLQGGKVLAVDAILNSKKALFQPGHQFE